MRKVTVPKEGSPEWTEWIVDELNKPMGFLPQFLRRFRRGARTLDLLDLVRETLDGPDPQAIGAFILSMTRSATDVLGLYLLAKYCGLFRDDTAAKAAACASCRSSKPSTTCAPAPPS